MYARYHHFDWLRANIELRLAQVDRVIATLLYASRGAPGVNGNEPWVEELFEKRQIVQSTLFELEQQVEE